MPRPPGQAPATEFELRDYLRVFRSRKKTIIFAALLVVAAAVASSLLQTPVYASSAKVLLQPRGTDLLFESSAAAVQPANLVKTEIEVIQSESIQAAAREKLGNGRTATASQVGDTNVIEIRSESTDPKTAATVANTYANTYIDSRRTQAINDTLEASKQVQAKIADLQLQIDQATGGQKEALVQAQALFKQKLDQLQVNSSLKTGGAQLVGTASTPTVPVKPNLRKNVALALATGLLLGVALAVLIDYLDDSIKTKEDLNRVAPGVAVIALVPAVAGWSGEEARVLSLDDPKSAAAEAYRTLRTSIQFLSLEHPIRTLQITSPNSQEGKTTTLANLAVALARAGQRVTVVCCDLRRPRLHEFFGLDNSAGFTSVLLGKVPLSSALQDVPGVSGLRLLSSGALPPNPSELLASSRTMQVLNALEADADIVLVDSPPILPVTDAIVLSGHVDATVLVCVARATTRKDAARAVEMLEQVDAPLMGTVLNGVSTAGAYGYDYQYFRNYQQDVSAKPRRRPTKKANGTRKPAAKRLSSAREP